MKTQEDIRFLLCVAQGKEDAAALALDSFVHDAKSMEATEVNNSGLEAQVRYLVESGQSVDLIRCQILKA